MKGASRRAPPMDQNAVNFIRFSTNFAKSYVDVSPTPNEGWHPYGESWIRPSLPVTACMFQL